MANKTTPVIRLGLCLAGAVSAGAYTAGVIDYLLETLERWEKAKELFPDDPRIPRHRVEIEVITGSSAGGMCGGFLVLQGHKKFDIFKPPTPANPCTSTLNPDWHKSESLLYDAWVNMTEGGRTPMMEQLLNTRDICFGAISSLLNAKFIDDLTTKFINNTKYDQSAWPKYLSKELEFATSITNIDGIETEIEFNRIKTQPIARNVHKYKMVSAKDFGHFQLTAPDEDKKIKNNLKYGQIPLNIMHEEGNRQLLGSVMQATGAFPLGFKPRKIVRKGANIKLNPLITGGVVLKQLKDDEDYTHWMVDGGAVNNEPFETAAFLLDRKYEDRKRKNPQAEYKKNIIEGTLDFVNRNKSGGAKDGEFQTVLMIDPFPNTDSIAAVNSKKQLTVIGSALKLLGALRHQPLVKPVSVYKAVSGSSDYSRFMLAPRRKELDINGKTIEQIDGSPAIACGALGGFSGFLNKEYREHDYKLGRFNCQHFIQKLFGFRILPVDFWVLVPPKLIRGVEYSIEANAANCTPGAIYNPGAQSFLVRYGVFPFIPDLIIGPRGIVLNQMNDYSGNAVNSDAPIYPTFPSKSLAAVTDAFIQWNEATRKRLKKIAIKLLSKQGLPDFVTAFIFKYYWKLKLKDALNELVFSELDEHGLIKK